MKRWLWFITAGLVAGVALASIISRDPGYALLQVSGYRLETSVVALILAVLGLLMALRLCIRLVGTLVGVVPGVGRWLGKRKQEQNLELIQSSLDDALADDAMSLESKASKLEKSSWYSESRAKQMRRWLLKGQIRSSQKASQLNKIWSKAAASDRDDMSLKAEYVTRLYQLGAVNDVDAVLMETAASTWHDALNGIIAVHRPKNAEQLLERLTTISATDKSKVITRAIALLHASALDDESCETLLIEAHKKQASEHLIMALGARRLHRGD